MTASAETGVEGQGTDADGQELSRSDQTSLSQTPPEEQTQTNGSGPMQPHDGQPSAHTERA